jgi:hypothetical protein
MTEPTKKRIPRGTPEVITEEKLVVGASGQVVNIRRNLGPLSLTQFMARSKNESVRGLIVGEDVLYWDAFFATHHEIALALGIDYNPDDRCEIFRHGDEALLVEVPEPLETPRAALAKLSSPNIYFLKPSGKWEAGDRLAA